MVLILEATVTDFRALIEWLIIIYLPHVPALPSDSVALQKFVLKRNELLSNAPFKFACVKLALVRLAPMSLAPLRLLPVRLAPLKSE